MAENGSLNLILYEYSASLKHHSAKDLNMFPGTKENVIEVAKRFGNNYFASAS